MMRNHNRNRGFIAYVWRAVSSRQRLPRLPRRYWVEDGQLPDARARHAMGLAVARNATDAKRFHHVHPTRYKHHIKFYNPRRVRYALRRLRDLWPWPW